MNQIKHSFGHLPAQFKRFLSAALVPSKSTLSNSEQIFVWLFPYILGTVFTGITYLLRINMIHIISDRAPFSLFLFGILFSALFGGLYPGLFTSVISILVTVYFFLNPIGSFYVVELVDQVLVVIFAALGLSVSLGAELLRSAWKRAFESTIIHELTEQSGDLASWIYDIKTQETIWSGALEQVYGLQNFTTENWISGVPEPDSAHATNVLLNSINSKLPFETEFRFNTPSGKIKWIWTKGNVICDKNGAPIKVLGINRDITAQKHLEENLRQAKDEAEAANLAKSAFLANMSHEIRTPLGALLGFSDLLVNEQLSDSDRLNYSAAIKRNGIFLSAVINDILDLSKVESGKFEVEKHQVSLPEILADLTTLLNMQAREKGLKLSVVAEGTVPNTIETDSVRIRQILFNIVGNAIKFTERGAIEVKISLKLRHGKTALIFDVTDSGIGVSPLQASKLFVPFVQADVSTKRTHGGTGLGLVLSKKLAHLLGGDVVLSESTFGKGSTFSISIDPGQMTNVLFDNSTRVPVEPPPSTSFPDTKLEGIRILLVEDALDNQIIITRFLKLAGATVETAGNGQEALDQVQKSLFDLLLMDLQMPIMDGYEATAELRKKGFKTPIIALTAHALKEERLRCLASGFDDHLCKPVDRKMLITSVAHFTQKNQKNLNN